MGFGIIFLGYLSLLFFKAIPIELIGFYAIFTGLDRLCGYNKYFKYAKHASAVMFILSIPISAAWIARVAGMWTELLSSSAYIYTEQIIYHIGLAVFHLLLYKALYEISRSVGYFGGKKKAKFSLVTMIIFYLGEICMAILPDLSGYLMKPVFAFQIIWFISTAILIYGCYMRICTDEQLAREKKKIAEFDAKYGQKKKAAEQTAKSIARSASKKWKNKKGTSYKVKRS